MNETLSTNQESRDWREKLGPHENAAPLSGEEVWKILGSSLAGGRSLYDELHQVDSISDYAYKEETRRIDGALKELAGLRISGEDQSSFHQDLFGLANALKIEQEKLPLGTAPYLELARRRESAAYLLGLFEDEIKAPQDAAERGAAPGKAGLARREWINQTIKEHNNRVESLTGGTVAASPEAREAWERIAANHKESVGRSSETADEARRRVDKVLNDTGEREQQALLGEVVAAAKGTARIHTDRPEDVRVKSSSGEYLPLDGFASFGDGLSQKNGHGHGTMLEYKGAAEAMLFMPDTTIRYKTVTKTIKTEGWLRDKIEHVEERVPDGEVPVMITNPATGQQEPGVKVAYQFDGQVSSYGGPEYRTESGRSGNQLFVEVTLPKSIADKLQQAIIADPAIAREFAKSLVIDNGITEQTWDRIVRPPYDQTPDGWEMTVANLRHDTQFSDVLRYSVESHQAIKTQH